MADELGTIVSHWQIEQAVINTLQQPPPGGTFPRLVYYLAELERLNGLGPQTLPVPPGANSWRGGVDNFTFEAEWFPVVHVVVRPFGAPERMDPGEYMQVYEINVTATVGADDENWARQIAFHYGAAIAKTVMDQGSLGISATNTVLTNYGTPALLDPVNSRQVVRITVGFGTLIAPILTTGAPSTWQLNPYESPGQYPTVSTINPTVTAVPINQQV